VIERRRGFHLDLAELRRFRELFYFFAWRDIKVRYKQTFFGAAWAIFRPFITMVVFTLLFADVPELAPEGVPYALFSYTGLLYWTYFSSSLSGASNSLIVMQQVVSKVYFPRVIAPISATFASVVDFAVASLIFVGLLIFYSTTPHLLGVVLFVPMLLVSFIAASGAGMFLAALNVKYRDVREALPFFIQLLIFLTPVIYPATFVPESWRWVLFLNPMTGVITTMRLTLFGGELELGLLAISLVSALVMFAVGFAYFSSTERRFADVI
jgi:lipopolysaccharide transport system permease protein